MTDYLSSIARFEFERDTDNGMLVGPDGCHYNTEAEAMYYGQIGLCGCGRPEDVHEFLILCLSAKRDDYPSLIDFKKIAEIIKDDPEVVAEFVLHFLDLRNMTEHGGSVYGSWLTDRGKQVIEAGVMQE